MKYSFVFPLVVLITTFASGQKRYLDSLHQLLSDGKQDTANVLAGKNFKKKSPMNYGIKSFRPEKSFLLS